jgi:hypothetical protein
VAVVEEPSSSVEAPSGAVVVDVFDKVLDCL